jgi:hypothetical protein
MELRWRLQSFGSVVEVLSPNGMRKSFKEMAQQLSDIYNPS